MKVIGLLGGMSWQSTELYHRLCNEMVAERLGGLHSARLVLSTVDFAELAELQRSGRWAEAGEMLAGLAKGVEAAGAELLLVTANTMHLVIDAVAAAVAIPVLHIADTAAAAARRDGVEVIGLLGTAFTMEQPFYRERLAASGLEVLVPGEADRAATHQLIYSELALGTFTDDARRSQREVVARLVERGAKGIVLGCTELELLLDANDAAVPLYPTSRLHVAAAVDAALGTTVGHQPPAR